MKKLMVLSALLIAVLPLLLCNCGYRLAGLGNTLPDHIKSVAIPDFDNKTTRSQLDQYITFAVKEEFIQRSNLKIESQVDNADALLEGTITRFLVKPVSVGEEGSANLYRVTIELDVRLIDLKSNDILFEGQGISFSDSYDIDDEDFFTRETETLLEIVEEIAASVVTSVLENF